MHPIRTFTVAPSLPAPIARLQELAYNLRWTWDSDTRELFVRLDRRLWEQCGHNPVRMLGLLSRRQLEEAASDEGFLGHYAEVCRRFDAYLQARSSWFSQLYGASLPGAGGQVLVAYFSAEFGLTEAIPMYSGGLGNLAGDHFKSASDLGVPIVGVGLLYHQGYFRQMLNADGWQQESFPDYDVYSMPLVLVRRPDGMPLTVQVSLPGRQVVAQIWRVAVGRATLYLLDANLAANTPEDRVITHRLYGGDVDMRIRQEILLGMGGVRALAAMGLAPRVFHMNEGHSAFLSLERIRRLMDEHDLTFAEAREAAAAGQIFTTHTPVPAGHDYFQPDLMERYFGDYYRSVGLSRHEFLALGRQNPADDREAFCMTVLALRTAAHTNGVSRLHGAVARRMWQGVWPGVPEAELPIHSVTNGVHALSWTSQDMASLYDRYLGPRWREEPDDPQVWEHLVDIPPEELWRTHERRRERLVAFVRRRLRAQLEARGALVAEVAEAEQVLEPGALTIGFARRFATYKRATLLLQDPERLIRILTDPKRPVQVIVAGKAHPRDDAGKEMIRQIVRMARRPELRRRLVFLEDYDIAMARYLVQGCDVWLNTPRRPEEASGTSGMKAALNGVLNLSVLDGWWNEAYRPEIGWAIGPGGESPEGETVEAVVRDPATRDRLEAQALYEVLEREVVPLFYDRGPDGLPRGWIEKMLASIQSVAPAFNTHRMVKEYVHRFYVPAAQRAARLAADGMARARVLARWKAETAAAWGEVRVEEVRVLNGDQMRLGQAFEVEAAVRLGRLRPADVVVELCLGRVDPKGELADCEVLPMTLETPEGGAAGSAVQAEAAVFSKAGAGAVGAPGEAAPKGAPADGRAAGPADGRWVFVARRVVPRRSGLHGLQVRVRAHHPELAEPFETGLIRWAG